MSEIRKLIPVFVPGFPHPLIVRKNLHTTVMAGETAADKRMSIRSMNHNTHKLVQGTSNQPRNVLDNSAAFDRCNLRMRPQLRAQSPANRKCRSPNRCHPSKLSGQHARRNEQKGYMQHYCAGAPTSAGTSTSHHNVHLSSSTLWTLTSNRGKSGTFQVPTVHRENP